MRQVDPFAAPFTIRFTHSHDNLLGKLLYWPAILGLLLGVIVGCFS